MLCRVRVGNGSGILWDLGFGIWDLGRREEGGEE